MRTAAVVLLSCVASAFAYQVTGPTSTQGWTNQGAQTVTWTRVDTDAPTFAMLLTNIDRSALPVDNLELAAQVDGTKGSLAVNPPSGGWPTGHTFRLNFVKDTNDTSTILAQSNEFNITASTSTSGTTTATTAKSTGTTLVVSATGTGTGTGTGTSSSSTGTSTDSSSPPGSNGATSVVGSAGLMAALALLGAILA